MKTREQIIYEIEYIPNLYFLENGIIKFSPGKIIDLVVESCEEVALDTIKGYTTDEVREIVQVNRVLENLKKLKSK